MVFSIYIVFYNNNKKYLLRMKTFNSNVMFIVNGEDNII